MYKYPYQTLQEYMTLKLRVEKMKEQIAKDEARMQVLWEQLPKLKSE